MLFYFCFITQKEVWIYSPSFVFHEKGNMENKIAVLIFLFFVVLGE